MDVDEGPGEGLQHDPAASRVVQVDVCQPYDPDFVDAELIKGPQDAGDL